MNIFVSKQALQQFVSEALDGNALALLGNENYIKVNNVVDQSASLTDPSNKNQIPQNKVELKVVLNKMLDSSQVQNLPDIYKSIKDIINNVEDENKMNKNIKESLRTIVKKAMNEAPLPPVRKIPFGVHGDEYSRSIAASKASLRKTMKADDIVEPEDSYDDEKVAKPIRKVKSTSLGSMTDVQGASFEDIAKELNFSVAGAKQAVDKALEKARWLASEMDEDELEILVLRTMDDYINTLAETGELSDADIRLMKDHPSIVRELDGFREYLSSAIRRERKASSSSIEEHKKLVKEALASVGIK